MAAALGTHDKVEADGSAALGLDVPTQLQQLADEVIE
jgi:hypothetical protein